MPTSKPKNPGPGPDQRPPAIASDAELARRLVAALEQLGVAVAPDARKDDHRWYDHPVDPVRARASRDYEVLRGMLGRADAPTALRMQRVRTYGQGEPAGEEKGGSQWEFSDNAVVVEDLVPLSARYARVESPGDPGTSPRSERVDIGLGDRRPKLPLKQITAELPISRVEIFDEKNKLVAFGRSFDPLPQPYDQPSGGR